EAASKGNGARRLLRHANGVVAFRRAGLEKISARPRPEIGERIKRHLAMIETLSRQLQQPEYLHVLLNPLPVYGLAVAVFGLIAALYLGSRDGQITAFILIFATAISAWPVAHYGDAAEDRVVAMADEAGQAWLKAHAH